MDKIKILYIEDDAGQRKQFAEQMASQGFKVISTASGEAGLHSFKKSRVDAVLCDLNMPKMDGLEVLKKIKKIDADVPVIILTAHGSVHMAVKALKVGAYDFVLKPPEINKISTTIHKAIETIQLQIQLEQSKKELKEYSQKLEKRVEERTERLEYANRQLIALNEVSNKFSSIYSEKELLKEAPKLLCKSLDFDRATMFLNKNGRLALYSLCMARDSEELVRNFLNRVKSKKFKMPPHFMESIEQNKTIFISDLNADPRWPKDEPGQIIRTKAVVVSPIKAEKKSIGIIVGNMQHHDRDMDDKDIARFEMFANMVGFALDNIRSYRTLETKVLERTKELRYANLQLRRKAKESEKKTYSLGKANVDLLAAQEELEQKHSEMAKLLKDLSESEEKFRQLTENINEAFWMADLNARKTIYVSPAYEQIYGRPAKNLYRNSFDWLEAIHPDDRTRVSENINKHRSKENEQEFRIVRPDKSVRWIRSRAFPIRNSKGEIYRVCGVSTDITERKQAREALERERNFVSAILDTAGALVVVLDLKGRIIRFNRACEETTGYSFEQVKGKHVWDLFLIPTEVLRVRATFDKLIGGDFPNRTENYWLTKEGEQRLIDWSNTALVDKEGNIEFVIGTGIDITERKQTEEKLKLYREIFINSHDAIAIYDPQGIFLEINPAHKKFLEYTEKDLHGKTPAILIGEDTFQEIGTELERKGSFRGEIVSYSKSGKPIDVELSAFTIYNDKSEVHHRVGFARDITERKQAEKTLKETQTQLVQSEKMASLGMLVAGIAHEINTPIGAVSSMHDTLKRAVRKLKETLEAQFPKELQEHGGLSKPLRVIEDANRVIDHGSERVITIVRRLRSFARLDEAELKTVDIHEGLEDTLTLIHHEIKHNLKVIKNFGDIPPMACFPGRLNQVFLNLLINSKQAIKDKGEITITTSQKNGKVHIEFKDNGSGIPKDKLKKIFDPGYTTKGVGVGTGLGLSIVYQIIEDHKGTITVESEVGKGTTFTIIFPMNLDELLEKT